MGQFIAMCALILHGSLSPSFLERRVLLFGEKTSPLLSQQWELLRKDSVGFKERDVQLQIVPAGDPLYKTYQVSRKDTFTLILIGRDAGEKYRSSELTTSAQIFALIDAMPMRKAEVRRKKNLP